MSKKTTTEKATTETGIKKALATLGLPESFEISLSRGKFKAEFDLTEIASHPDGLMYLVRNGGTQSGQDSYAGAKDNKRRIKDDGQPRYSVEDMQQVLLNERIDKIHAGTMGLRESQATIGRTPLETAVAETIAGIKKILKKNWDEKFWSAVNDVVENGKAPKILEMAQAKLDAMNSGIDDLEF